MTESPRDDHELAEQARAASEEARAASEHAEESVRLAEELAKSIEGESTAVPDAGINDARGVDPDSATAGDHDADADQNQDSAQDVDADADMGYGGTDLSSGGYGSGPVGP